MYILKLYVTHQKYNLDPLLVTTHSLGIFTPVLLNNNVTNLMHKLSNRQIRKMINSPKLVAILIFFYVYLIILYLIS